MTIRRRIAFALATVVLAVGCTAAGLLAVDVHLHSKYQKSAGFNIWGYRGPVVGRKQPGEFRIVVLGGSAAFGYGVDWAEAIPAHLEQRLAAVVPARRFTVVNLGYNNEGAYSLRFTLEDYLSFDYDLACLYEGYNDLMGDPRGPNLSVFRHDSPVFRLTGYLPIFPIIFREKAAAMRHGDTGAIYSDARQTTFRPNLAGRTGAEILDAAAGVGQSLEQQLGRALAEPSRAIPVDDRRAADFPGSSTAARSRTRCNSRSPTVSRCSSSRSLTRSVKNCVRAMSAAG